MRLAWEMFHKIYHMYSDINNKEETNAALLPTIISYHKDMNKVRKTTVKSHDNHQNKFPFQVRTIVPSTSIISNQETLKCVTVMKLGLTPMVNGTRLYVLTSYLKGK